LCIQQGALNAVHPLGVVLRLPGKNVLTVSDTVLML